MKKKFDEYGYALNDIVWGRVQMGDTLYKTRWGFFVEFIEKETNEKFELELSGFMNEKELKKPRLFKKEIVDAIKGGDIVSFYELLAEKDPDRMKKILEKTPKSLLEKVNIQEIIENSNTL